MAVFQTTITRSTGATVNVTLRESVDGFMLMRLNGGEHEFAVIMVDPTDPSTYCFGDVELDGGDLSGLYDLIDTLP